MRLLFFLSLLFCTFLSAEKKICIAWSKPDHPIRTHEYKKFSEKWKTLCESVEGISVETVEGFPKKENWEKADLVIFFMTVRKFGKDEQKLLDDHLAKGGGFMAIHQALVMHNKHGDPQEWADRTGFAYKFGKSKYGKGDYEFKIDTEKALLSGMKSFPMKDELYWNLQKGTKGKISVMATAKATLKGKEAEWPCMWTVEHEKGRVFSSVFGHFFIHFDRPEYKEALLRGTAWTLNEPFKKFAPLLK